MPRRRPKPLDPHTEAGRQAADALTDVLASVLNRLDDEERALQTTSRHITNDSEAA